MDKIFKRTSFFKVDYYKLEAYLKKKFPKTNPEIPCEWECGNDCVLTVDIGCEPFDEWDQNYFDNLIKNGDCGDDGDGGIITSQQSLLLMRSLCQTGELEEGEYLIKVSW